MDNLVNQVINGRYEILELVGKGGMAKVYRAHDNVDDREVAIKFLDAQFLDDEDMCNRFRNEANAIACLSHPNIVKIYDFYCDKNLAYIVMEYVSGITLREYIRATNAVSANEAAHYIVQILRGLQHAHDKGIFHRDIKPENIILLPNASVKVSDFGIAKLTHGRGVAIEEERNFGSVRYMSPEQINLGNIDCRSDIYAVGILLYELVTGKLPFDSDDDDQVALMQLHHYPVKPSVVNPGVPIGIEQLILRAIQKAPENRFSSAADFLVDLNEFRKNNSIVFDYNLERAVSAPTKNINTFVNNEVPAAQEDTSADNDAEEKEEEEEGKSMVVPIIIASCVSILLIAAIVVLVIFGGAIKGTVSNGSGGFFSSLFSSDKVEVPNFINMEFDKALEMYPDLAIDNPPAYEYNSTYEDGHVCDQSPAAGDKVSKDTVIKLTVAASGEMVLVQESAGHTSEEAKAMYEADGFNVVLVPVKDASVKLGEVISTTPTANKFVARGSSIYVYYSADTAGDGLIKVPDLTGYDQSAAKAKLEAAGLKLGAVTETASPASQKGLVISQSPSSSASVKEGVYVNIVVGSGIPDESTASFGVVLPNIGKKGTIKVVLNGEVVSSSGGISLNGQNYSLSLTGSDKNNTFEVYVDDMLLYSGSVDFTTTPVSFSNVETHQYTAREYIPNVTGMVESAAKSELNKAGFTRVVVQTQNSDKVPAGTVISQSPENSSSTKYTTTTQVTIVVSAGPVPTTAPVIETTTAAQETPSADVETTKAEGGDEPVSETTTIDENNYF